MITARQVAGLVSALQAAGYTWAVRRVRAGCRAGRLPFEVPGDGVAVVVRLAAMAHEGPPGSLVASADRDGRSTLVARESGVVKPDKPPWSRAMGRKSVVLPDWQWEALAATGNTSKAVREAVAEWHARRQAGPEEEG